MCCESVCIGADLGWTSDGSAGCTFTRTQSDLLLTPQESTGTQKSAADLLRIRHKYLHGGAVEFLVSKKPKKSASPPKESESVCHRLFFDFCGLFWWTRVQLPATDSLQIHCGFLVRSLFHLKISSNYGQLEKSHSKSSF